MDTFADGPSQQPETPAGGPGRRRRWPFVVGGLMALGLIGLSIVAVVLILAAGGPTVPPVYAEECGRRRSVHDSRRARRGYDSRCR